MKIELYARGLISDDEIARNREYTNSVGARRIVGADTHFTPLAVVGSGPSIRSKIDQLKDWSGEVWAINGTHRWCRENGIDAMFLTIDPLPQVISAERSLVADHVHPSVIDALSKSDVCVFSIGADIVTGPTTATSAPGLGVTLGYSPISFFGCEGSFSDVTHGYEKPADEVTHVEKYKMIVRVGGRRYETCAEFLMQAEYLAAMIRLAPNVFKDESGGLLGALVADPDWDAEAVTEEMFEGLTWHGKHGN